MNNQPLTKREIRELCADFADRYEVPVTVRFGTEQTSRYLRACATLLLGTDMAMAPAWAGYYQLLCLLRGAHQIHHPHAYAPLVARSVDYTVGTDGTCARWCSDGWRTVHMAEWQTPADWRAAADNLPCRVEAAEWAAEEAYDLMTNDVERDNLHQLHYWSMPKTSYDATRYTALFDAIDRLTQPSSAT